MSKIAFAKIMIIIIATLLQHTLVYWISKILDKKKQKVTCLGNHPYHNRNLGTFFPYPDWLQGPSLSCSNFPIQRKPETFS